MCNNNLKKNSFSLQPGEVLPNEKLQKLNQINQNYSKQRDFAKYLSDIADLFTISPVKVTEESKLFLGGFIEAEGSMNISLKKLKTAKFGLLIDPEFSITQHVNGVRNLYLALQVFHTGRIRHKHGSNATLVFVIDNRVSLQTKVLPFIETHVKPYGSPVKAERLGNFQKLIQLMKDNGHTKLEVFRNQLLPIWESMRMQQGQSNQSFATLTDAQQFVDDFWRYKTSNK